MMGMKKSVFGLICLILLGLTSCKTTKLATNTTTAKPISAAKLIKNIENNTFEYDYLAIKKITCQYDNGNTKYSFKASILAEKDKQITVMVSKLNIPVGRLWLTPDSVKFINYLEKSYFLDDYSYLSSWLDMNLDFNTVNAIISNNVFSLYDKKAVRDDHEFETRIDSGMYVLESIAQLKAKKVNQRAVAKKPARKQKRVIADSPVNQSIYVDPETYKLRKIKMEDKTNSRNLYIGFSDYTPVEKQIYPGEISLHFVNPDGFIQLRIKLAGFSTEKENEVKFRVPEKFTRINTN